MKTGAGKKSDVRGQKSAEKIVKEVALAGEL